MLRQTRASIAFHRRALDAQVIGADVPSYSTFPYRATAILRLYRDFWRLIYRHPPHERHDLIFKLRNEFRSKRHLHGEKVVGTALKRGQMLLEVQKTMMESKVMRQEGFARSRGDRNGSLKGVTGSGAQSVDAVWEQLRVATGGTIPGLRAHHNSRNVTFASAYGRTGVAVRARR